MKIPPPGHIEMAVVRVDGGRRFSRGGVPKPQLADPTKLPKGVLAIVDVGRVRKQPTVLVARVLLVNLNKRAARKKASAADFNIATGFKWPPLRYTLPIGVAMQDCAGNSTQIVCTGSDPKQAALYGWQTTSIDNYIAFFAVEQTGIQLSHELGFGPNSAQNQMTAPKGIDVSYFQSGFALGGKFYLNRPTGQRVSPYLAVDAFKYFVVLDTVTRPASAGSPNPSGSASANPQTPCNNQNNYDPKFPDYTQLHEYCSKAVTGLTIHASVPLTAAGWFGPIANEPKCASVNSKTATCTNITKLPKLTTFIVYASHPGGWPSGDTASATLTFDDGSKQTEVFWVD